MIINATQINEYEDIIISKFNVPNINSLFDLPICLTIKWNSDTSVSSHSYNTINVNLSDDISSQNIITYICNTYEEAENIYNKLYKIANCLEHNTVLINKLTIFNKNHPNFIFPIFKNVRIA